MINDANPSTKVNILTDILEFSYGLARMPYITHKLHQIKFIWVSGGGRQSSTRGCANVKGNQVTWLRHQMQSFSALLALRVGNSPVTGEFPAQRPVTRSFDVSFDLRLNKRLSKQPWGWWFETPSWYSWRHRIEGKVDLQDQWAF